MPTPIPDGQDPGSPFGAFAFHVHFAAAEGANFAPFEGVDAAISGGFSDVTGLEATMEAKTIKEGGRNYGVLQRAGQVTFATVVLKRGLMESRHLWRWWSFWAGADGANNGGWSAAARCHVSIAMIRDRKPVLGWRLENAMPVKFRAGDLNARGTDVAIEEIHLAHEGLHMTGVA
jgi:phage tail-like protein